MVDPDDTVHWRLNKRSLNGILRSLDVHMGRPY